MSNYVEPGPRPSPQSLNEHGETFVEWRERTGQLKLSDDGEAQYAREDLSAISRQPIDPHGPEWEPVGKEIVSRGWSVSEGSPGYLLVYDRPSMSEPGPVPQLLKSGTFEEIRDWVVTQ